MPSPPLALTLRCMELVVMLVPPPPAATLP
jgi:hypothetical protein